MPALAEPIASVAAHSTLNLTMTMTRTQRHNAPNLAVPSVAALGIVEFAENLNIVLVGLIVDMGMGYTLT